MAARPQIVMIGEGAVKMRKGAGAERPLDLVGARGWLVVETGVAAAARVEVRVGHAVAFPRRASERVGHHLRAEPGHSTRHLVPVDPTVLRILERSIAAPEMEVRAA